MIDKLHKDVICTELFYKLIRKHEVFFFSAREVLHFFSVLLTLADSMWFFVRHGFVNIFSRSF